MQPRHMKQPTRAARTANHIRVALKTLGIVMSVLILSASGIGLYAFTHITSEATYFSLGDSQESIPAIGATSGAVNLLLVGSDTRNGQTGHYGTNPGSSLNDVNILLHISQDHSKATIVSIPRDTYVNVPTCKDSNGNTLPAETDVKINTTLSRGGVACVRDTVEELTGIKIPYAALITFDGVVKMSNAIGGVQVCVAKAINDGYTGLHLSAGEHTLKGAQALEFLRTRHGVGDGSDLTRISSQQVFLSSLVRKLKANATLNNIPELYGIANAAVSSMELSTSLNSLDTLVSIARALAPISLDKVAFVQYPTILQDDGVVPNTAAAKILVTAIKKDQTIKFSTTATSSDTGLPGSITKKSSTSSTGSATPSSTPTPSATTTPDPTATLSPDTYGQTAAEQTCSVGNDLGSR